MTDDTPTISTTLPAIAPTATPPARAPRRRREVAPDKPKITRKVRLAVRDMVWLGLSVADAASKHRIQGAAFSRALSRPSVQELIRSEVQVLKASHKPMAARRIIALAAQNDSLKVALDAAKHIDTDGKADQLQGGVNVQVNITPGYLVDVSGYRIEQPQMPNLMPATAKPLIEHDDVPQSD